MALYQISGSRTGSGTFIREGELFFKADPKTGKRISQEPEKDPSVLDALGGPSAVQAALGEKASKDFSASILATPPKKVPAGTRFTPEGLRSIGGVDLSTQPYVRTEIMPLATTGQKVRVGFREDGSWEVIDYNPIEGRQQEIQAEADRQMVSEPSERDAFRETFGISQDSFKELFGKAPEAPAPAEERLRGLREREGLGDLEGQLQETNESLRSLQDEIASGARKIKGELVSSTVIGRKLVKLDADTKDALQELQTERANLIDRIKTKNQIVSDMMTLQQQDFINARNLYNDQFDRNYKLYNLLDEERDEQEKIANANLKIMRDLLEQGNLVYEDLPDEAKMMIEANDLKAYGATGITSQIRATEKEIEIDTFTDESGNRVTTMYNPTTKSTRQIFLGKVGIDKVIPPSAGFFDSGIEGDVREDYGVLADEFDDRFNPTDEERQGAFRRLRDLYSPQEATDEALKRLTGITKPEETGVEVSEAGISDLSVEQAAQIWLGDTQISPSTGLFAGFKRLLGEGELTIRFQELDRKFRFGEKMTEQEKKEYFALLRQKEGK